MGSLGFTLADRLGAKSLPCSVPGCARTWISMAGAGAKQGKNGKNLNLGGRGAAQADDPASSMCDPCRDKLAKTRDQARACDRPGCAGTWTWPVAAQLAAFATKRPAPQSLCADCEQKLAALEDKPVPCSVEGCTRASVLTKRAQLLAGAPEVEVTAAAAMCGQCDGVYQKLKDRQVSCGINGCKHKWLWSRDEQIVAYAAGLTNDPPRRMCDECKLAFGGIADREVRCRASGCKKTWTWTRGDQLDACVGGKPAPKAPHRMCDSCHALYQNLKDVDRPCRRSGCKGTWLDKRGAQLARAVRGKTGEPYPQYCETCEKELGDLEDRQVACKTDNCTGTWTWTKAAQLAAGVRPEPRHEDHKDEEHRNEEHKHDEAEAPVEMSSTSAEASAPVGATADAAAAEGQAPSVPETGTVTAAPPAGKRRRNKNRKRREIKPPERRCQACLEFLGERKTIELACQGCKTPIYWPPESQLQTHLGAWAEPSLCGACKRDLTEAQRMAEREALRHPHAEPSAEAEGQPTSVEAAAAVPAPSPESSVTPEASS
ncbi:MAG TPA: hypothetical protein VLA14_08270 [Polyangia bacterium]|jgi:hypothetical protein|nr:hypothetical protein [Polyangia bacterium]